MCSQLFFFSRRRRCSIRRLLVFCRMQRDEMGCGRRTPVCTLHLKRLHSPRTESLLGALRRLIWWESSHGFWFIFVAAELVLIFQCVLLCATQKQARAFCLACAASRLQIFCFTLFYMSLFSHGARGLSPIDSVGPKSWEGFAECSHTFCRFLRALDPPHGQRWTRCSAAAAARSPAPIRHGKTISPVCSLATHQLTQPTTSKAQNKMLEFSPAAANAPWYSYTYDFCKLLTSFNSLQNCFCADNKNIQRTVVTYT